MGLFSSFTKPFTNIAKAVVSIATNPVKAITSGTLTNVLLTGGLSLAVPKLNAALSPVTSFLTDPRKALPIAGAILTGNPALALSAFRPPSMNQGVQPMGFNVGQFLGGVGTALGQSSNSYIGGIGQIASAFAPAYSAQNLNGGYGVYPVAQQQKQQQQPIVIKPSRQMTRTRGLSSFVLGILATIAETLGRKSITLRAAVKMIRKMSKYLISPEAIALALGIGISQLAELITADAARPHRRMNAANGKALHRAARRIKSFHRMCGTIDLLKGKGRRAPVRFASCGTCRKNPCRC